MKNHEIFATLCRQAAEREMLKKAVFTAPTDKTVLRAAGTLRRVGGATKLQIETFYADGKARHENLVIDKAGEARLAEIAAGFGRINLLTTAGDAELRQNKKGNTVLLGADKLSRRLLEGSGEAVPTSLPACAPFATASLPATSPF